MHAEHLTRRIPQAHYRFNLPIPRSSLQVSAAERGLGLVFWLSVPSHPPQLARNATPIPDSAQSFINSTA
jgi:hypothetical protein